MSQSLNATIARISRERGWRKRFTPDELVSSWEQFVIQCSRGYAMNIYEYENDRSIRTMIHQVLAAADLEQSGSAKEFESAVTKVDARFHALLQPEVALGRADAPWWERGVPLYAGEELATDFHTLFGVTVAVVNSQNQARIQAAEDVGEEGAGST